MGYNSISAAVWAIAALAGSQFANAGPSTPPASIRRDSKRCNAATFKDVIPPEAQITNVTFVPKGGQAGEGPPDILYPVVATDLPELCAVTVKVTSSPSSAYRFGLYLPSAPHDWKERFLAVGNGGFGGGIHWLDMAPGPHYGAASMSTDTGHNSSVADITWALNQPEKRTDWGWRAMHGSVELAKKMTEAFYGKPIKYSYYNGCSTGGRQGLKEVQISPSSFDGALIGAPSWDVKYINPFAARIGVNNLPVDDPKHIPASAFPMLANAVTAQCDIVDGIQDGIVSSPELCTFDFDKVKCGNSAADASNCLSDAQIGTAKSFYADYYSEKGEFFYTGITLSSELGWGVLMGGSEPSPFGTQYIQNFVYNNQSWRWQDYSDQVVYDSVRLDAGNSTADQYDVTPYKARGGKIVMYHGLADGLVATRGSQLYLNRTIEKMGPVDGWFRYFEIPGMQHCVGSYVGAPWAIAGASQPGSLVNSSGLYSVPGFKDSHHDAVLALMKWVEEGKAVDSITATTWNQPLNSSSGVLRQRPICPYPQKARYNNRGDINKASSWKCA